MGDEIKKLKEMIYTSEIRRTKIACIALVFAILINISCNLTIDIYTYVFAGLILLSILRLSITRYRINKGWYGNNGHETREIIHYIQKITKFKI